MRSLPAGYAGHSLGSSKDSLCTCSVCAVAHHGYRPPRDAQSPAGLGARGCHGAREGNERSATYPWSQVSCSKSAQRFLNGLLQERQKLLERGPLVAQGCLGLLCVIPVEGAWSVAVGAFLRRNSQDLV